MAVGKGSRLPLVISIFTNENALVVKKVINKNKNILLIIILLTFLLRQN